MLAAGIKTPGLSTDVAIDGGHAYVADGTAGLRVIDHRETPGLGDAVDRRKSDWVESFRGRALGDPPVDAWNVRKDGGDFDQFTGATITPRAVVKAARRALEYAAANSAELFEQPQEAQPDRPAAGAVEGGTGG